MNTHELWQQLQPLIIKEITAHITGALTSSTSSQFLRVDGSRSLIGNLAVASLVTIDGVDISVLNTIVTGHVGGTAAAGHSGIGAHNHQTTLNGGLLDHGAALSGLADDDHTQYLNSTRHNDTAHSAINHHALAGLLDDDHTQYLNTTRHDTTTRHTLGTVVPHDDHGAISGLADDDHTQYLNATRHNDTAHSGINHHTFAGLGDDDHTQYLLVNGTRDMSGHIIPATSDLYDLGGATRLWRKGYLSELEALVFAEQTIQLVGGWLMICKDQGTLQAGAAAANTQIDFGKAMSLNDFVLMRSSGQVEYMQIGALVGGTKYNVTRNLDGSGANDWPPGAPFAVLGTLGAGRIELNAYDTPRISVLKQSTTYNVNTELIRMGDLNGYGDYNTVKYGLAIGEYAALKPNIIIDEDGILKFRIHNVSVMEFGGGNADITGKLRMPGATSAITIGATPPTSAALGTGIWLDRTGFYGLASNVEQVKIDAATGKLIAGAGSVTLDANGMSILGGVLDRNKISFKNGADTVATIHSGLQFSYDISLILNAYQNAIVGSGVGVNVWDATATKCVSVDVDYAGLHIQPHGAGSPTPYLWTHGAIVAGTSGTADIFAQGDIVSYKYDPSLPVQGKLNQMLTLKQLDTDPTNIASYGQIWYGGAADWWFGKNDVNNNRYPLGVTQLSIPLTAWKRTSNVIETETVAGNPELQFPDSAYGTITTDFVIPAGWGGRTVKITFWWWTGGTGNVVWGGELRKLVHGGSLSSSSSSIGSVTAAANNVIAKSTMNLNLPANVIEGQATKLGFYRNGAHASDTRAANAWLLSIMVHVV